MWGIRSCPFLWLTGSSLITSPFAWSWLLVSFFSSLLFFKQNLFFDLGIPTHFFEREGIKRHHIVSNTRFWNSSNIRDLQISSLIRRKTYLDDLLISVSIELKSYLLSKAREFHLSVVSKQLTQDIRIELRKKLTPGNRIFFHYLNSLYHLPPIFYITFSVKSG